MASFKTRLEAESDSGLNSTEILPLYTVRPTLNKHMEIMAIATKN